MHTYDTPQRCAEERNGCAKAATLIREIITLTEAEKNYDPTYQGFGGER